jgi:hypothetical protein
MDIGERSLSPTTHARLRGPHQSTLAPLPGVYSAVAFTMQTETRCWSVHQGGNQYGVRQSGRGGGSLGLAQEGG